MKVTRLDDYQSWMFETRNARVLLDPWLVGDIKIRGQKWLFHRQHQTPPRLDVDQLPKIDAVLLSAFFDDHLHAETLRHFSPDTPFFTHRLAEKHLRALGFSDISALAPTSSATLKDTLQITAIQPGFPYAHNSTGFLLRDLQEDHSVYIETHTVGRHAARHLPPVVDAVIAPCESVTMLGVQFSMGPKRSAKVAARFQPRFFLPTGLQPRNAGGAFSTWLLNFSGTAEEFEHELASLQLQTKLVPLDTPELDLAAAAPRSQSKSM